MENENASKKILVVCLIFVLIGCGVGYDLILGKGYSKQFFEQVSSNIKIGEENEAMPVNLGNDETEEDVISSQPSANTIKYETSSKSSFRIMDKGIIQSSKDGVKYYTDFNAQKWNSTYTMSTPVLIGEGIYNATADTTGRSVKMYGENGEMYSHQFDGDIMRIAINQNGYMAAITYIKPDYRIQVFDNTGQEILKREEKSEGVYPLDLDISDDNKVLAVSYVDTSDVEIVGKVLFFYTSKEEGKEFADAIFSAVQKNDEIIGEIEFLNNRLVCIGDNNIYGYGQDGSEIWSRELTNKITQAKFYGKEMLVVAYGESFSSAEGVAEGTVEWIGISGKTSSTYDFGQNVTYLSADKKGVIIGNYNNYIGVSNQGKLLWEYKSAQDLTDLFFYQSTDKVMVVGKAAAEVIDMKNIKK